MALKSLANNTASLKDGGGVQKYSPVTKKKDEEQEEKTTAQEKAAAAPKAAEPAADPAEKKTSITLGNGKTLTQQKTTANPAEAVKPVFEASRQSASAVTPLQQSRAKMDKLKAYSDMKNKQAGDLYEKWVTSGSDADYDAWEKAEDRGTMAFERYRSAKSSYDTTLKNSRLSDRESKALKEEYTALMGKAFNNEATPEERKRLVSIAQMLADDSDNLFETIGHTAGSGAARWAGSLADFAALAIDTNRIFSMLDQGQIYGPVKEAYDAWREAAGMAARYYEGYLANGYNWADEERGASEMNRLNTKVGDAYNNMLRTMENFMNERGMLESRAKDAANALNNKAEEWLSQAKQNKGYLAQVLIDAGESGVEMALDAIASKLVGLPASPAVKEKLSLALMALRVMGGESREARANGASVVQAGEGGATAALIELLSENLEGIGDLYGKGALDDAINGFINAVDDKTIAFLFKTISGGSGEAMEEFVSGVLSPVVRQNYDPDALRKGMSEEDWQDTWHSMLCAAITSSIIGGGGQIVGDIKQWANSRQAQELLAEAEAAGISGEEIVQAINDGLKSPAAPYGTKQDSGTPGGRPAGETLRDRQMQTRPESVADVVGSVVEEAAGGAANNGTPKGHAPGETVKGREMNTRPERSYEETADSIAKILTGEEYDTDLVSESRTQDEIIDRAARGEITDEEAAKQLVVAMDRANDFMSRAEDWLNGQDEDTSDALNYSPSEADLNYFKQHDVELYDLAMSGIGYDEFLESLIDLMATSEGGFYRTEDSDLDFDIGEAVPAEEETASAERKNYESEAAVVDDVVNKAAGEKPKPKRFAPDDILDRSLDKDRTAEPKPVPEALWNVIGKDIGVLLKDAWMAGGEHANDFGSLPVREFYRDFGNVELIKLISNAFRNHKIGIHDTLIGLRGKEYFAGTQNFGKGINADGTPGASEGPLIYGINGKSFTEIAGNSVLDIPDPKIKRGFVTSKSIFYPLQIFEGKAATRAVYKVTDIAQAMAFLNTLNEESRNAVLRHDVVFTNSNVDSVDWGVTFTTGNIPSDGRAIDLTGYPVIDAKEAERRTAAAEERRAQEEAEREQKLAETIRKAKEEAQRLKAAAEERRAAEAKAAETKTEAEVVDEVVSEAAQEKPAERPAEQTRPETEADAVDESIREAILGAEAAPAAEAENEAKPAEEKRELKWTDPETGETLVGDEIPEDVREWLEDHPEYKGEQEQTEDFEDGYDEYSEEEDEEMPEAEEEETVAEEETADEEVPEAAEEEAETPEAAAAEEAVAEAEEAARAEAEAVEAAVEEAAAERSEPGIESHTEAVLGDEDARATSRFSVNSGRHTVEAQGAKPGPKLNHKVVHDADITAEAKAAVEADFEGEVRRLAAKAAENNGEGGAFDAFDVEESFIILKTLARDSVVSGNTDALYKWANIHNSQMSELGRALHEARKYAQSGASALENAAKTITEAVESGKITEEEGKKAISEAAKASAALDDIIDDMPPESERDTESGRERLGDIRTRLKDLIKMLSELRGTGTLVSKNLDKLLDMFDSNVGFLQSIAMAQVQAYANDVTAKKSFGDKLKSYQVMAQLTSIPTALRNLLGNDTFNMVDAFAQNSVGRMFDFFVAKGTGKRVVKKDSSSWFNKQTRKAANEAFFRSVLEVALDVNTDGGKYMGGGRTFRPNGNAMERVFSRWEQLLSYALTSTDQLAKGRTAEGVTQNFTEADNVTAEDISAVGQTAAEYRTFQNKGTAYNMAKGAHDLLNLAGTGGTVDSHGRHGGIGVADMVMPYPGVPANLAAKGLEYSPINMVKGVAEMLKIVSDVKGGKKFKSGEAAVRQYNAVMDFARGLTGTAMIAASAFLASLGFIKNFDDEDDYDIASENRVQGKSGIQINLSALERWLNGEGTNTGWRSGDKTLNVGAIEPLNIQMAIGVMIAKDSDNRFDNGLYGIFGSVADMPALKGISDLADSLQYAKGDTFTEKAADVIGKNVGSAASGFIPAPFRQFATASDDYARDTSGDNAWETAWNGILAAIPGARESLPQKLDGYGNAIENNGTKFDQVFNAMFNPLRYSTIDQNDIRAEVERLYNELGDSDAYKDIYPDRKAENSFSCNGTKYELTAAEKRKYLDASGDKIEMLYKNAMTSPYWYKLTDEQKVNVLHTLKLDGENAGKRAIVEGRGDKYKESTADKATNTVSFEIGKELAKAANMNYTKDDNGRLKPIDYKQVDFVVRNVYGAMSQKDKELFENTYSYADNLAEAAEVGLDSRTWYTYLGHYKRLDGLEDLTQQDKAEHFRQIIDSDDKLNDEQKSFIKGNLKYWQQIAASTTTYDKLTAGGIDSQIAIDFRNERSKWSNSNASIAKAILESVPAEYQEQVWELVKPKTSKKKWSQVKGTAGKAKLKEEAGDEDEEEEEYTSPNTPASTTNDKAYYDAQVEAILAQFH